MRPLATGTLITAVDSSLGLQLLQQLTTDNVVCTHCRALERTAWNY